MPAHSNNLERLEVAKELEGALASEEVACVKENTLVRPVFPP